MKLEGIRVIDLCVPAGPLSDARDGRHGAEVIKVGPPGEGDPGRRIGGLSDGPGTVLREPALGEHTASISKTIPE
jgi:crotonobetainyl-CoA:carnitine CoA-transferase CaiB-like acyl-CoA transferase